MKRGHGESQYVKLFAEATGKKLRTAQDHRARNSAEWQAFMEAQGSTSLTQPGAGGVAAGEAELDGPAGAFLKVMQGEAELTPEANLSQAERHERSAVALWEANVAAAKEAARLGYAGAAVTFSKVAADCYRQVLAARRAREADEIRRRTVLPAAEFEDFRRALIQVAALVRGLDRELSNRVNPENPAYARAQISGWLRERWNPAIEEMIAQAGNYAHPPGAVEGFGEASGAVP